VRYLLDTNVVSEPMRPKPAPGILRGLCEHDGDIVIPAPVWHELRFGCARLAPSRRREALEHYIEDVVRANYPVLGYDQDAADWHALERARLAAVGCTPPFVDGQIAAIAVVNDLTLVTANVQDFDQFLQLKMQSWA